MAKSKNRRKKSKPVKRVQLNPESYIRKVARKLPIHECLISVNWKKEGFTPIIISRKRANGNYIATTYIVDLQCLGVKNTSYIFNIPLYSYQENIKIMSEGMSINFMKIEPSLAFNIIYGAVEYADDLGFEPHKDFTNVTEYMLDEVSTIEYVELKFGGKDGKPLFVSGPYDNVAQIMATLNKNAGEGNYHFIAEIFPDQEIELPPED